MSTGDGLDHHCVTVGPVTRTAGMLAIIGVGHPANVGHYVSLI